MASPGWERLDWSYSPEIWHCCLARPLLMEVRAHEGPRLVLGTVRLSIEAWEMGEKWSWTCAGHWGRQTTLGSLSWQNVGITRCTVNLALIKNGQMEGNLDHLPSVFFPPPLELLVLPPVMSPRGERWPQGAARRCQCYNWSGRLCPS